MATIALLIPAAELLSPVYLSAASTLVLIALATWERTMGYLCPQPVVGLGALTLSTMMHRWMNACRAPRRRSLAAALALAAAIAMPVATAEPQTDPATASIRVFYDVLLDTMKHAKELGVQGRYDKLAPAIRAAYDLAAMTRIAVGPSWPSIPPEQQAALVDSFARMTIATYANRFDGYSGERFEIDPAPEPRGANRIVRTKVIKTNGEPVTLNYLMHGSGDNWKIVDVYLSGTISELATRRSEFGAILKSGGAKALVDALRERGDKLLKSG